MRNSETIPSFKGELTFSNYQWLNGTKLIFQLSVVEWGSLTLALETQKRMASLKTRS